MSNNYYSNGRTLVDGDIARAEDVNQEFDRVVSAFDKLPTPRSDGKGFLAPVKVGEAINSDEAITKNQLDSQISSNYENLIGAQQAQAAAEQAQAAAEFTANTAKWVSGVSYLEGQNAWSPLNYQTYRSKTNHSGISIDPSIDESNWEIIGLGGDDLLKVDEIGVTVQGLLISGENIKTINGESVLGLGNLEVGGGGGDFVAITENSKTGYGTSYRAANPKNYGDIGTQAVDLTYATNSFYAITGATGDYAFTAGHNCLASGISSIALGRSASTNGIKSKLAIGASSSVATNDGKGATQTGFVTLGATIDGTANKTLTAFRDATPNTTNQLIVPNNGVQAFKGLVVARDSLTTIAMWEFTGLIKRGSNASATTLAYSNVTKLYSDTGLASATVTLSADTVNGGLSVVANNGENIGVDWTCSIWTAEVIP